MLKKLKLGAEGLLSNYKSRLPRVSRLKRLTMCKKCFSFHYRNSWHFEMPDYLKDYHDEEVPVLFIICLSCLEEEDVAIEKENDLAFGRN